MNNDNVFELATFTVTMFSMLAAVVAALATWFNVSVSKNLLKEQSTESKRLRMPFITVIPSNWEFKIPPIPIDLDNKEEDEDEYEEDDEDYEDSPKSRYKLFDYIEEDDELESILQSITINEEELIYRHGYLDSTKELDIKLLNIHYGVAKDVYIKCEIPNLSSFEREWSGIINSDRYKNFKISNGSFLTLNFDDYYDRGELYFEKSSENKYLIANSIENNLDTESRNSLTITLPNAFIFLLNIYVLEYNVDRETKFPIPTLKLEIECKDLLDDKHLFEINYKLNHIQYIVNYKDELYKVNPIYDIDHKKIL